MAAGIFVGPSSVCSGNNSIDGQYYDPVAVDEWMRAWMDSPKAVSGVLHMGRFADRTYYLTKKISWAPEPGIDLPRVEVPKGFVTDLTSIPRVFWSIFPPDGLYTYPAIIHDYLYWDQKIPRENADKIFQYAMEEFKVNTASVKTIYLGVRAGGHVAWSNNASLKDSGEKRVLKTFPTDPKTRWNEWKNRSDVFG